MKTVVYFDAFNFYFGAIKGTPFRWVDLGKLCSFLLPNNQITVIKYFTARVRPQPHDPDQPVRQQIYWRALRTLPILSICEGHFLVHTVSMPLAQPPAGGPRFADVIKVEEKGSDVNLATQLLCDAFRNKFEVAVLITGDSDLVSPLRAVKEEIGKRVGVINPQSRPCKPLRDHATFYRQSIRSGVLAASQFPTTMTDAGGTFHKPPTW
jgi:uncharacterized LabA/DUF88 family protein